MIQHAYDAQNRNIIGPDSLSTEQITGELDMTRLAQSLAVCLGFPRNRPSADNICRTPIFLRRFASNWVSYLAPEPVPN